VLFVPPCRPPDRGDKIRKDAVQGVLRCGAETSASENKIGAAGLLANDISVTLTISRRNEAWIRWFLGDGMAVASVTPRVRTIVICDDVSASLTEDRVFTLECARLHLQATSFPCRAALNVFLLLSSARRGTYYGKILVVNERNDKLIRYVKFDATFGENNELLPLCVDIGECAFPEAGTYTFEVYFSARGGGEAIKSELPFRVLSH